MRYELTVPDHVDGQRLDIWLESALTGCTRSLISRLIRAGHCSLSGRDGQPRAAKPGHTLHGGERVALEVPDVEPLTATPEDIPLTVLHEDAQLAVIDKPPGMVVHPAAGHAHGTLVHALLHRYGDTLPAPAMGGDEGDGETADATRAGIVHRLDEDTSGLIVVARTPEALACLQDAFRHRDVHKRYLALVAGRPRADFFEHAGWIGRHPRDFRKRTVLPAGTAGAKESYTSFVVLERHDGYAALECRPRTGRTHQIRVHLAATGHPVLADHTYGRGRTWPLHATTDTVPVLRRQALHAWSIDIPHPAGGRLHLTAPIPADLAPWVAAGLKPRG